MTVRYYDPLPLFHIVDWPGWYCDRCFGIKLDLPSSDPALPVHHEWCPDYAPPPQKG